VIISMTVATEFIITCQQAFFKD